MAGYDSIDDDYDDLDNPRTSSRFVPILLSIAAVLGAVFSSWQLYLVAYGNIPGEFIGSASNQIQLDEGMVNIPAALIYEAPDNKSKVLYQVKAGDRFPLDGREGQFFRLPLPTGNFGFVPMTSITPGFMFLKEESERRSYDRRFFPKRFVRVVNSYWEDRGRGRSSLTVELRNSSEVPIDKAWISILFQNEDGETMETRDMLLEGRVESDGTFQFTGLEIDLGGNSYPQSQIEITNISVATETPAI